MALIWVRAQAEFRHKEHCVRLAQRLDEIEATRQDNPAAVRAARELQMMLGVVVDQLVRSRNEYVQPSLFQRMLVQFYLDETTPPGNRALTLLREATHGMAPEIANELMTQWNEMLTWFIVRPEEVAMMNAIVSARS